MCTKQFGMHSILLNVGIDKCQVSCPAVWFCLVRNLGRATWWQYSWARCRARGASKTDRRRTSGCSNRLFGRFIENYRLDCTVKPPRCYTFIATGSGKNFEHFINVPSSKESRGIWKILQWIRNVVALESFPLGRSIFFSKRIESKVWLWLKPFWIRW